MGREAHTGTLSVQLVRVIVGYAASRGVAPAALLDPVGLCEDDLLDVDGRVPAATMVKLWALAPALASEPDFGLLLGEATGPAGAPLLTKLFLAHRTLGDGLARVLTYLRVANDVNGVELEEDGAIVHLRFSDKDPALPLPRHAAEYGMASLVAIARGAAGDDLCPLSVAFGHPEPERTETHARLFRSRVTFGGPRTEVTFRRADLDRPMKTHDPLLVELLEHQARAALERLPARPTFTQRVREAIVRLLPSGNADLDGVAAHLRTTPRTLQRWLRDEDTTFQAVLDDARRSLAELLLRERDHTIAEVALLVGFSDQASFHKAFVRWTGTTPARARAPRRGGP